MRVASDDPFEHHAACHCAHFGDANDLTDFNETYVVFAAFRSKHAAHGSLNIIYGVVDDVVVADVDAVVFSQFSSQCIGTDVEA